MQLDKIFVIGCNKTATSTFHILFEKNGLSSQHDGSHWDVEDYQCFSDNGDMRPWQDYAQRWPDSVFILNVRPLDAWILSRAKHCYPEKLLWGYPPRKDIFKRWAKHRNNHHLEALRLFKEQPWRLLLVDITQPAWVEFVCRTLGLKPSELRVNEARQNIPDSFVYEAKQVMSKIFRGMGVSPGDEKSVFLLDSLLQPKEREEAAELKALYASNF